MYKIAHNKYLAVLFFIFTLYALLANSISLTTSGGGGSGDITSVGTCASGACTPVLSTDTDGNYVASVTSSQGLLMTGTEAASLGLIDCAATEILKRNAGDTGWECSSDATGGALPAIDTTSIVEGSADATKEIRFEVDGITTGTIRVITPPNADFTMAGINIPNAFTDATNTFVGASYTGPTADSADAGIIKLGNGELIGWEASPTGTDVAVTVDATENVVFSGIPSAGFINLGTNLTGIRFGGTNRQITNEAAETFQCCAIDTNTDEDNSIDAPDATSGVNNGSSMGISGGAKSNTGLDGNVKLGKAATIQHLFTLGTDPVLSACGTTPTVAGNDISGNITIGTGVTTSCTVTFAKTYTAAPACVVNGDNAAVVYAKSTTATVLTITSSLDMASDQVSFFCTEAQ